MTKDNWIRLRELYVAIGEKSATSLEVDEYMILLRKNNSISECTYNGYLKDRTNERLIKSVFYIGGAVILTRMLSLLNERDRKNCAKSAPNDINISNQTA